MLDKIFNFSKKNALLPKGSTVICGLSGGADSVCLVFCLFNLKQYLGIDIEAIHVNHCIRGSESDRDEQFCRNFCSSLGIPITVVSCNVPEYAEKNSVSLEEAARILRYESFRLHSSGKIVATAHNANDNLETSLLNLARGSGIKGVAGIPPVRGNIVRPLLNVTRAEIENFLYENNLTYVTDSTNLSDDYTRNKIRHLILPVISEINPSAVETFIKSSDTMRDENAFIEAESERALSMCRKENTLYDLSRFHSVIRRRCIAKLLSDNSVPYSHDRLEACEQIALNGGKINIQKNIFLISNGKELKLDKIEPYVQNEQISAELIIGENHVFDGKVLYAEIISVNKLQISEIINTKLAIYHLDYDKIKGRTVLRNRRFGDKIRLSGNNFTSSVKKLINERVPVGQRKKLHFIEDEQGTIFAEGIGIADRTAPGESTKNYLKITIKSS